MNHAHYGCSIEGDFALARPNSPRSQLGRPMSPALPAAGSAQPSFAMPAPGGQLRASYAGPPARTSDAGAAPRLSFVGAAAPKWPPSGRSSPASIAPARDLQEQQAAAQNQQRLQVGRGADMLASACSRGNHESTSCPIECSLLSLCFTVRKLRPSAGPTIDNNEGLLAPFAVLRARRLPSP